MYWLWNKDVLFLALVRLEINVSILRINKFRGLNAQKLHPQRDGVFHFEADVALPTRLALQLPDLATRKKLL